MALLDLQTLESEEFTHTGASTVSLLSCVSAGVIPAAGSSSSSSRGRVAVARAISRRRRFAYESEYAGWLQR